MGNFDDIPDEIIEQILSRLCAKDLLAAAATCRRFRLLVETSSVLQLVLELAMEGFRLSNSWICDINSYKPKQVGLEFNQRRRKNQYTHQLTISLPSDRQILGKGQLIDGMLGYIIFVSPLERYLMIWDLRHSVMARSVDKSHSDAATVAGDVRLQADPDIKHRLEFKPIYFTWDVVQDLLVLFENRALRSAHYTPRGDIHIRSLSTNAAHPLAKQHTIPSETQCLNAQVHKSYLIAVLDRNTGDFYVAVYNWEIGELLYPLESIALTRTAQIIDDASDFQLLSPELILVVSWADHKSVTQSETVTMNVHTLAEGMLRCVLRLPPLPRPAIELIQNSIGFSGEINNHTNGLRGESLNPYVYQPGNDRISVGRVYLNNGSGEYEVSGHVVVSIQRLLDIPPFKSAFFAPNTGTKPSSLNVPVLNWPQWGPPSTRWFLGSLDINSVCGSQFMIMREEKYGNDYQRVTRLFDFSQRYHYHRRYMNQHSKSKIAGSEDDAEARRNAHTANKSETREGLTVVGEAVMAAEGNETNDWLSSLLPNRGEEQIVTKEWVLEEDLRHIQESFPATTDHESTTTAAVDVDDVTSTTDYRAGKIHSQLPFRVYNKSFPKILSECRRDSVYLGVDEVVGEGSDGVIHAFIF